MMNFDFIPADWSQLSMQEGMIVILRIIFVLVSAASVFYALYLVFMLAKAEDASKRKQAKDRIIKTLATIVIVLILAGIVMAYESWMMPINDPNDFDTGNFSRISDWWYYLKSI